MIKQNESVIVNGLQEYLGCPVILANQHSPAPKYPYVSFTNIAPIKANNGTFCTNFDGHYHKAVKQTWSFTVQSDNDSECSEIVSKAFDWFSLVGIDYLSDNQIYVERLEDIRNRDNLITIQYEYRRGFDVVFVINDEIDLNFETIESITLDNNKEIEQKTDQELVDEILGVVSNV